MATKWVSRLAILALSIAALVLIALPVAAQGNTFASSGVIASGAQYDLYEVELGVGEGVYATLVCDFDGVSRPLDPILTAFAPGDDTSTIDFAPYYNDDGFGTDDDANGVDCDGFQSSRLIFSAPIAGTWTFRADGFGSTTGPYTLTVTTTPNLNPLVADGRINPQQAAPFVAYCDGTSVAFFSVTGTPLFTVEAGGSNSGSGINVTTLADGRMQATSTFPDGKGYLLVFDGCPNGTYEAYTLEATPNLFDSGSYGTGDASGNGK